MRSTAARSLRDRPDRISAFPVFEAFEQVGGVVGLELRGGLDQHRARQSRHQLVAHRAVEFGQHLEVERVPHRRHYRDARLGRQVRDQVGEVRRRQLQAEGAGAGLVAGLQRFRHRPDERLDAGWGVLSRGGGL